MSDVIDAVRSVRFDLTTEADPSKPTTAFEWHASGDGAFKSGFWASQPGRAEVHYQKDELCVILDGKVRLTDQSGHIETYQKGDVFLIPNGFKGLWETLEPTRKIYAIYKSS